MATSKTAAKKSIAVVGGNKSMAEVDAEMNTELAGLKERLGQVSGSKIKVEASGHFVLPDGTNLGSEIQIVVIDFSRRHNFYSRPYIAGQIIPPDCYAMGKVIDTMAPEEDSPAIQNDDCKTCPQNQFGSAVNGTAKACQNRYSVAVLLVNPDDPDEHNNPKAQIHLLDLPPTALGAFDSMVKGVARSLGLPVKAIITAIASPKGTYAAITFDDPVPNPDYAAHYQRKGEVQDMLFRKPDFSQPEPPARGRAPAARRGAVQAAPARKQAGTRR